MSFNCPQELYHFTHTYTGNYNKLNLPKSSQKYINHNAHTHRGQRKPVKWKKDLTVIQTYLIWWQIHLIHLCNWKKKQFKNLYRRCYNHNHNAILNFINGPERLNGALLSHILNKMLQAHFPEIIKQKSNSFWVPSFL